VNRFNLRTYAIIINNRNELLVSDENRFGRAFTKFPGGGLEWGEGLADGLQRELLEEMKLKVEIGSLFFVNDFFQKSAFREEDQLLSFYFWVRPISFDAIPTTDHEVPPKEEGERFRWISLKDLSEEQFTFPLDKIVARRLKLEQASI
jgi:ADP-ribose pyrophosphatase YjhB (NUDIX family)